MGKVVVNNGQYKITIPKELAEAKGWTSQTRLRFVELSDGSILLKETIVPQATNHKPRKNGGKK